MAAINLDVDSTYPGWQCDCILTGIGQTVLWTILLLHWETGNGHWKGHAGKCTQTLPLAIL